MSKGKDITPGVNTLLIGGRFINTLTREECMDAIVYLHIENEKLKNNYFDAENRVTRSMEYALKLKFKE